MEQLGLASFQRDLKNPQSKFTKDQLGKAGEPFQGTGATVSFTLSVLVP
jgi:hypothetical protein